MQIAHFESAPAHDSEQHNPGHPSPATKSNKKQHQVASPFNSLKSHAASLASKFDSKAPFTFGRTQYMRIKKP
jgi:hypothetical protein